MTTLSAPAGASARRGPCPRCGAPILLGARKCPTCRRWLDAPTRARSRAWKALALVVAAAAATVALWKRPSPVGTAPPLTPMLLPGSADPATSGEPLPGAIGPTGDGAARDGAAAAATDGLWRSRTLRLDGRPLDAVFSDDGSVVFVSSEDAHIREIEVGSGRLLHAPLIPAIGDRLRLIQGRYLAIIRRREASYIPLLDVATWDREPVVLKVGPDPIDVLAMPDGKTVMTATGSGRRVGWYDLATGGALAELRLPHDTEQLFLLHADGRSLIGALGVASQGGAPTNASLEIFDPQERPFGATRRSVSLGRAPRGGAVAPDGKRLLIADRLSNCAWLYDSGTAARPVSIAVGQEPIAAFVLEGRHGVTLDRQTRTATVIDLDRGQRSNTLMLPSAPRAGAASPDGKWLAVVLGPGGTPPTGSGVVVIGGDPPRVVARFDTGDGAGSISFSRDGRKVVVTAYASRELTILEH